MEKAKNLWSKYKGHIGIFLTLVFGISIFYGLYPIGDHMRDSAQVYLDQFNIEDIEISSSHGFDQEEIQLIESTSSPEFISVAYEMDVGIAGTDKLVKVESMPESWVKYELIQGEFPKQAGQIVIDQALVTEDMNIGDTVSLQLKGNNPSLRLGRDTFTLVGTISSPDKILVAEKASSVATGSDIDGYALIHPEDFDILYPNLVRLHLRETQGESFFTERYKAIVDNKTYELREAFVNMPEEKRDRVRELAEISIVSSTEDIASLNADIQSYDKNIEDLTEQIKTEQEALDLATKEFNEKVKEAEDILAKGQDEIDKLKEEIKKLEDDIDSYINQINDKNAEIASLEKSVANLNSSLAGQEANLETRQNSIDTERAGIDAQIASNNSRIDSLNSELRSLRIRRTILLGSSNSIDMQISRTQDSISNLEDSNSRLASQLSDLNSQQEILDGEYQALAPRIEERNYEQARLDEAVNLRSDLEESRAEAEENLDTSEENLKNTETRFKEAKTFLEGGAKEEEEKALEKRNSDLLANIDNLNEQLENQESYRARAQEKISKNQEIISRSQEELDNNILPSYSFIQTSESDAVKTFLFITSRVDMMTRITPLAIFILALIALASIVYSILENNKNQYLEDRSGFFLGFLKKLLPIILLAIIAGITIGYFGFSHAIYRIYSDTIRLNPEGFGFFPSALGIIFLGILISLFLALYLFNRQLRDREGEVESFYKGSNPYFANLMSKPLRVVTTVLSLMVACGILVLAIFINRSLNSIPDLQYDKVLAYDVKVSVPPEAKEDSMTDLNFFLSDIKNARQVENILESRGQIHQVALANVDFDLIVPESMEGIKTLIKLQAIESPFKEEPKLLISEKISRLSALSTGDNARLSIGKRDIFEAQVDGVFENYVGNFVIMAPDLFTELTGSQPQFNRKIVKLKDSSEFALGNFESSAKEFPSVQGIDTKLEEKVETKNLIRPLSFICYVYIIAGFLMVLFILIFLNTRMSLVRLEEFDYDTDTGLDFLKRINIQHMALTALGLALGIGLGGLFYLYALGLRVPDSLNMPSVAELLDIIVMIISVILIGWFIQLTVEGNWERKFGPSDYEDEANLEI